MVGEGHAGDAGDARTEGEESIFLKKNGVEVLWIGKNVVPLQRFSQSLARILEWLAYIAKCDLTI